jgi:hypothetical protein
MQRKYNQGVADANRRRTTHGATVDARGGKVDRLYKLWTGIKNRCLNSNHKHYHRYGGRGITVCREWADSYEVFRAAVGDAPAGMTLDRIDNSKGYEPDNVRWATRKEQANNRDTNVVVTWEGQSKTLMQWAEQLGWKYGLIASRWKLGLRDADLFAAPKHERNKTVTHKGEAKTLREWSDISGIPYVTLHWRNKHGKELL